MAWPWRLSFSDYAPSFSIPLCLLLSFLLCSAVVSLFCPNLPCYAFSFYEMSFPVLSYSLVPCPFLFCDSFRALICPTLHDSVLPSPFCLALLCSACLCSIPPFHQCCVLVCPAVPLLLCSACSSPVCPLAALNVQAESIYARLPSADKTSRR